MHRQYLTSIRWGELTPQECCRPTGMKFLHPMRLRSAAQSGVKPGERLLTVSNLRLAAPTQREHHRLVVAWTNTGPGPGSSLLSIRADTRLTDVEACRRRIIIDLPGSSRSDLPSQFWDRNNRSSPDRSGKPFRP